MSNKVNGLWAVNSSSVFMFFRFRQQPERVAFRDEGWR